MLIVMNTPLNCSTQDLLEAAIVQQRRLTIRCVSETGETAVHIKVLPIDINSQNGREYLTVLTTDNDGGILKLTIDTSHIRAFAALDSRQPAINFSKE